MAKVLYITANPKPIEKSYSLSIGEEFLNEYKKANPQDEITRLDLYKITIPYIDLDVFNGWDKLQQKVEWEKLSEKEKEKVQNINQLTDQFIETDKYVFVTPLWNLSVPPVMRSYIDTICVAGKTFKYTEQGPIGLLKGKKGIHIQARGGIYSQGPAKDLEFGDKYIKALLTFLGVQVSESIVAEGMDYQPAEAAQIKEKAIQEAQRIARSF